MTVQAIELYYYRYADLNKCLNPLTAAIQEFGNTFCIKWRRYPGAQLERYLQNVAIIWGPARTLPAKWRRYLDSRLYT